MTVHTKVHRAALLGWLLACVLAARADVATVLDVGNQIPDAQDVRQALFPDEGCAAASEPAGERCGARLRVVRYSLSAADFRLGSAELPDVLRRQLAVFAEVMRGRKPAQGQLRIESHADASSPLDQAMALSQRRAEAVKGFLVQLGVDPALLSAVGMGAQAPRQADNPYAAQNRRIEIGRSTSLN